ncbi:MAG: ParA family protein [Bacteroidota bacterium]
MKTAVLYINNLKGGVAKTSSTANLGAGLARLGYKVLMIDWDPQANLTMHFGFDPKTEKDTLYTALDKENDDLYDLDKLIPLPVPIEHYQQHLFLLKANFDLSRFEPIFSAPDVGAIGHKALSNVLDNFRGKVDFVLIDCQPSLSLLTINAYYASDWLLIPAEAGIFSASGMDQILVSLRRINKNFEKNIQVAGVFFTRSHPNTVVEKDYTTYLDGREDVPMLHSKIRTNVAVKESQEVGVDIFTYDKQASGGAKKHLVSNATEDYYNLLNEILVKIGVKEETEKAREEEQPVNKETKYKKIKGDLKSSFQDFLKK